MAESLKLPVVDLSSSDQISSVKLIRQVCMDNGFFYIINHGVEEELLQNVFDESKNFFSLPLDEKMKLARSEDDIGFAPIYAANLDYSTGYKGDLKETFQIIPTQSEKSRINRWPSEEILPSWKFVMENYFNKVLSVGKQLSSLIALALNLDDDYFEKIGAIDKETGVLRLLHYPGEKGVSDEVVYGASAHTDYGMITLLATNGVPGLQVCREKLKQPQIWENVIHVEGAFIVNLGDLLERWTNMMFRSTLHRVMSTGEERYSIAFFIDPNPDCIVECLESCCSESSPPRFPPIRSGDHLKERISAAYSLYDDSKVL